ncbi:L,D-transpeptidase family protein [Bartonella senegalensis]|uniref:L,D-transpeptidase family protein n=1 Tax=Bartonella senegalensis TaxID=1468418 RepID=UPI0002DB2D14|nr:L,D-transpeptidase family protein [Bartonella senegalensis]
MQGKLKKKLYKKQSFVHFMVIRRQAGHCARGILRVGQNHFFCALGRTGISALKREGDGATPLARMRFLRGFRGNSSYFFPRSVLPFRRIRVQDGWCDVSGDANYNRLVRFPYCKSAEKMHREDGLYDIVLVLDWNITERKMARGSAIFMHLAREGYTPTKGCIALSRRDMKRLLPHISRQTTIIIAS